MPSWSAGAALPVADVLLGFENGPLGNQHRAANTNADEGKEYDFKDEEEEKAGEDTF